MRIKYVPLLELQRDIYRLPRNYDRFKHYLRTMINDAGDDLDIPPLVIMNPMAREHVPELLDQYLQLKTDQEAARMIGVIELELRELSGEFKMSLVVADDWKGGWTNRYTMEYGLRCCEYQRKGAKALQRAAWLTPILWSSESASLDTARQEVLMTIYRAAYRIQHGPSQTLRDMLAQEGFCMAKAGCLGPSLDDQELAYTREILSPHLDANDMPTAIACLFGDEAAMSLGFQTLGLSNRAGFALALHDARIVV